MRAEHRNNECEGGAKELAKPAKLNANVLCSCCGLQGEISVVNVEREGQGLMCALRSAIVLARSGKAAVIFRHVGFRSSAC